MRWRLLCWKVLEVDTDRVDMTQLGGIADAASAERPKCFQAIVAGSCAVFPTMDSEFRDTTVRARRVPAGPGEERWEGLSLRLL